MTKNDTSAKQSAMAKYRAKTTRIEFPCPISLKEDLLASLTGEGELPLEKFPANYFKNLIIPFLHFHLLSPEITEKLVYLAKVGQEKEREEKLEQAVKADANALLDLLQKGDTND